MQFGVVDYVNIAAIQWVGDECNDPSWRADWQPYCVYPGNIPAAFAAIDLIAEAGFTIVRNQAISIWHDLDLISPFIERFTDHGIDVLSLEYFFPLWAKQSDITLTHRALSQHGPVVDPRHFGEHMGRAAARYPQIPYWQLLNEPDLQGSYNEPDPVSLVDLYRAGALSVWYSNPHAVIVGPGFSQLTFDEVLPDGLRSRHSIELLNETLEYGLGDYVDIYDLHYYNGCSLVVYWDQQNGLDHMIRVIEAYREVLAKHEQGDKQFWLTEIGVHASADWIGNDQVEADCIVETLAYLDQRPDVNAAFIHSFFQASDEVRIGSSGLVMAPFENGTFTIKPAYWAVKEYIANRP